MPTSITPFTTTPSRTNTATFSADMDTRLSQENSRIVEMNLQSSENNVINTNVNAKEATAVSAASTATTKAGEALTSAAAALVSENAAAALLDSFDDRYLGAKAVEPTLDNDGNALLSGALYYNTVSDMMKVYDLALTTWMSLLFIPTNHGSLTGLADDDHPQYHNDARGDARYYTKAQVDALPIGMTATEVSSATSITLTATSANIQAVTMTDIELSVILPNATTLATGHTFIIKNTGTNVLFIKDGSGAAKLRISAKQIAVFYCTNIGSVAGVWAIGDESIGTGIASLYTGLATTVNAAPSTYTSVTTLSATQCLVTYRGTSNYLETCVLTVSGTTVTSGDVLTVNAAPSTYTSVTTLSATQALVTYSGTSGYLQTCTLNISGTTVTAGTVLTVNAALSAYTSVTTLSATQCLVTYSGTSSYLETCVLTVSGTTVTAGTVLTVNAAASTYTSVTTLSATQCLVTYSGTSSYLQANALGVVQ